MSRETLANLEVTVVLLFQSQHVLLPGPGVVAVFAFLGQLVHLHVTHHLGPFKLDVGTGPGVGGVSVVQVVVPGRLR